MTGAFPEAQALIEHGERVSHAAVGLTRDQGKGILVGLDLFGSENGAEPLANRRGPDPPEIETLQPGEHRRRLLRDLLGLGRGEDEDHARRRLLQDLEQRVPRFPGEHVGFVYDVDLVVARAGGGVHRALPQVPRVVDAAVAGRVDFHHVEIGVPVPDPEAALAFAAGLALPASSCPSARS